MRVGSRADVPMPEGRWLEVEGTRTRYFEAGSGAPIVFIYGGNFGTSESASSAYTWNLNLLPLADRFRTITFDKLGQGQTANPQHDDDYTMQAVVRHAAAFVRAMQLPPVHLVGHSRGAYAAARLALGQGLLALESWAEGLEQLLESVRRDPELEAGAARKKMLEVFEVLGLEDALANEYRFKLSLELFA